MDSAAEDEALEIAKSFAKAMEDVMKRPARKSRAKPLPPIDAIQACPHCGNDYEFYVKQTYSGSGIYRRHFDKSDADNSTMYDCINTTVSKRAYCSVCNRAVAQWDESVDGPKYI